MSPVFEGFATVAVIARYEGRTPAELTTLECPVRLSKIAPAAHLGQFDCRGAFCRRRGVSRIQRRVVKVFSVSRNSIGKWLLSAESV